MAAARPNLVFIGSHLGYAMEKTPLGGGAMVGLELARAWGKSAEFRFTAIGSGSLSPDPAIDYLQLPPTREDPPLVSLSELGYARFCRRFEAATTEYLLGNRARFDPRRTVVVVNDISESPDLEALADAGYPIISIWHVDVVDFFNRIYLGEFLPPWLWTRLFLGLEKGGLRRLVPDVLRLVFEKQQNAVRFSRRLVLPSRQMAETVQACYGPLEGRLLIRPWGGWRPEFSEDELDKESRRLRAHYQLGPHSKVLMTLSRISPEKGIVLLLEALAGLEKDRAFAATDVCVFVCGEAAFMRGQSYLRLVRRAASRLRRFRIFFPGYLSAFQKQAYFRLAQLFVSPSRHESYGLTLVEAMASGLPVLASDHYGVEEILDEGSGRLARYRSGRRPSASLARELKSLLLDPGLLKQMGAKAKTRAAGMGFSAAAREILEAAKELL